MLIDNSKKITVFVVNEDLENAKLARHSTLAQIFNIKSDKVYVLDLRENDPQNAKLKLVSISNDTLKEYSDAQQKIAKAINNRLPLPETKKFSSVGKFVDTNLTIADLCKNDYVKIINRLEPFDARHYESTLNDLLYLEQLKNNGIEVYNLPIYNSQKIVDKEMPFYFPKIMVPSIKCKTDFSGISDEQFTKIKNIIEQGKGIAIKPIDGCQGVGFRHIKLAKTKDEQQKNGVVFASQQHLKDKKIFISFLQQVQNNIADEILSKLSSISSLTNVTGRTTEQLVPGGLIIQEYLESVGKRGDIRVNISRGNGGKFIVTSITAREFVKDTKSLTAGICSGATHPVPVTDFLNTNEYESFIKNLEYFITSINNNKNLIKMYKNLDEAGLDFVPDGNGNVLLNEINHLCPALEHFYGFMQSSGYSIHSQIPHLTGSKIDHKVFSSKEATKDDEYGVTSKIGSKHWTQLDACKKTAIGLFD